MKHSGRIFLWSVAICVFVSQSIFAVTQEETLEKRIQIDNQKALQLKNINGNIEINSWDRPEIEILAFKKAHGSSERKVKRLLQEIEITIDRSGETIIVETLLPHQKEESRGFFSALFNIGDYGTAVRFELKVPSQFDLKIASTNGNLEISGCQGQHDFSTTNGNISAKALKGEVDCQSTNGRIEAELLEFNNGASIDCKTTNGSIYLTLPADVRADVNAKTTNGSIDLAYPEKVIHDQSRNSIKASINGGGPLIWLKTTNGNINIASL
ncbi:MAG: DUF4097 family beta strand repeat protein [Caldithrix sp.]|nr:DUF4097 family beta strand repeat protein [Caldithrix sp.]